MHQHKYLTIYVLIIKYSSKLTDFSTVRVNDPKNVKVIFNITYINI